MAVKELDENKNGFTFYWKINHFSFFSLSEEVSFDSPLFRIEQIDNTVWSLHLYAGQDMDYFELSIFREECDRGPYEIQLFFLKPNGDRVIEKIENVGAVKLSFIGETLKLNRSDIFDKEALFLPADTLTVGCFLKMHWGNMPLASECTASTDIALKIYSFTYPFKIPLKDFEPRNMTRISETSKSEKYPDFKIILETGLFSEIQLIKIKMSKSSFDVSAKCKLFAQNTKNQIVFLFEGAHKFLANREDQFWILTNSVGSNENILRLFKNKNFFMRCVLFASDGTHSSRIENLVHPVSVFKIKQQNFSSTPTQLSLKEKLKCLYADSRLCDFTLQVDGEELHIHKAVLGAVSPVFCSMFEMDMKERETSVSIIKDIDADTMQRLIHFAYSEIVEDLQWERAANLYNAANKYQISELKQCCATYLISNLTIDNITKVLFISVTYQDIDLEKAAGDFVFAHAKDVLSSKKWRAFVESNVITANKILQELCIKFALNENS